MSTTEKGKGKVSEYEENLEKELKKFKKSLFFFKKKERVIKLNIEIPQIKVTLKKENKWNNSSKIVNQLSERNHYERAGIVFHNYKVVTNNLCYFCGELGHPTTECHVARNCRNKNVEIKPNNVKTNMIIRNNI